PVGPCRDREHDQQLRRDHPDRLRCGHHAAGARGGSAQLPHIDGAQADGWPLARFEVWVGPMTMLSRFGKTRKPADDDGTAAQAPGPDTTEPIEGIEPVEPVEPSEAVQ